MIDALRDERITTWFDLGLMLDRLRDGRGTPSLNFDDDFDAFARHISRGVGLVTFHCSVDGVTVEIAKYAEAMRHVLPELQLHMITGRFDVALNRSWVPESSATSCPKLTDLLTGTSTGTSSIVTWSEEALSTTP